MEKIMDSVASQEDGEAYGKTHCDRKNLIDGFDVQSRQLKCQGRAYDRSNEVWSVQTIEDTIDLLYSEHV